MAAALAVYEVNASVAFNASGAFEPWGTASSLSPRDAVGGRGMWDSDLELMHAAALRA